MSIKTTHKGYDITFYDHDETWRCGSLDKSNASLAALKKSIDRILLAERKAEAVSCLHISYDNTISPATILGVEVLPRTYTDQYGRELSGPLKLSVTYTSKGANKATRKIVELSNLLEISDATREAVAHARLLRDQAIAADAAANKAWAAVPRLSEDAVAALIDIHKRGLEKKEGAA